MVKEDCSNCKYLQRFWYYRRPGSGEVLKVDVPKHLIGYCKFGGENSIFNVCGIDHAYRCSSWANVNGQLDLF